MLCYVVLCYVLLCFVVLWVWNSTPSFAARTIINHIVNISLKDTFSVYLSRLKTKFWPKHRDGKSELTTRARFELSTLKIPYHSHSICKKIFHFIKFWRCPVLDQRETSLTYQRGGEYSQGVIFALCIWWKITQVYAILIYLTPQLAKFVVGKLTHITRRAKKQN